MVRDGQLQKTRIYPPLSDAIEHKFVKILITTNYRSGGFVINFPGWKKGMKPGIFLFLQRIQSSTFSFGLCDVHQKFLIENDIIQGKCFDSHEVNGLVHLK